MSSFGLMFKSNIQSRNLPPSDSVDSLLGGSEDVPPAWYTPARLLVAFCVVSFLVFLDRGIIASNGVNGDKESRTGIQVS